uniref:Uncharacterized protein n=1 Tax=Chromera velia CCMP2878 TaxID=1169474 RepID=A0A0G4HD11_9ALVE|eukprot:Cvel_26405.t1-p1 / transcript=Cvel_26405.t1 / gene=Cvel_26405 / organism=Chromera_velia_CCMP2878 / gene_product=hypothetical protein / transcript_product=hypothetical protein / location=Cvel_scaffold3133:12789-13007(-) / protein_length=73 / sequence_SO=supercontig / SO=protein_coding / is_pseudo=false
MAPKRKAPDSGVKTTQSQKFLKFFVAAEKKEKGTTKADQPLLGSFVPPTAWKSPRQSSPRQSSPFRQSSPRPC